MDQATFSELGHDSKKRRTRREEFLARMDELIPWGRLEQRVEPFYPKAGRGRRPYPFGDDAARSLRAVVLQSERPWDGGSAVRGGIGAAFRRFAADGFAAGRDDDPALPAPAGAPRSRPDAVRGDQRAPGVAGASAQDWDDRGREHR